MLTQGTVVVTVIIIVVVVVLLLFSVIVKLNCMFFLVLLLILFGNVGSGPQNVRNVYYEHSNNKSATLANTTSIKTSPERRGNPV